MEYIATLSREEQTPDSIGSVAGSVYLRICHSLETGGIHVQAYMQGGLLKYLLFSLQEKNLFYIIIGQSFRISNDVTLHNFSRVQCQGFFVNLQVDFWSGFSCAADVWDRCCCLLKRESGKLIELRRRHSVGIFSSDPEIRGAEHGRRYWLVMAAHGAPPILEKTSLILIVEEDSGIRSIGARKL